MGRKIAEGEARGRMGDLWVIRAVSSARFAALLLWQNFALCGAVIFLLRISRKRKMETTDYTDWKRVMNDSALTHRVNTSILITHSSSVSIRVHLWFNFLF